MADEVTPGPSAGLAGAAQRLRVDAACAEALGALREAGVACLVLKGPSLARWLYPDGSRTYLDCDLLVDPEAHDRAAATLGRLGFEPTFDEQGMPEWWREHAREWVRRSDGVMVDLHREIPGVGVGPREAWPLLSEAPSTVEVAGRPVPTLGWPARALHLALHAAQHGVRPGHSIPDLERALEVAEPGLWRAALSLARRLQAVEPFAAGLRLTPAGAELADALELPANTSAEVLLRAGSAPPVALGFEQLARARGPVARVRILARKIVPPPSFIRHWDPSAAGSRRGLARAYLRRPLWLLSHAPAGLRAWGEARRRAAGAQRSEPISAATGGEAAGGDSSPRV